jgi:hypothetical protein
MADLHDDSARAPELGPESAAGSTDRQRSLAPAPEQQAIAALRQILLAITCAGKLLAAARQAGDAADRISPNELNALRDVLDAESRRRLRTAKAAVAALRRTPG